MFTKERLAVCVCVCVCACPPNLALHLLAFGLPLLCSNCTAAIWLKLNFRSVAPIQTQGSRVSVSNCETNSKAKFNSLEVNFCFQNHVCFRIYRIIKFSAVKFSGHIYNKHVYGVNNPFFLEFFCLFKTRMILTTVD